MRERRLGSIYRMLFSVVLAGASEMWEGVERYWQANEESREWKVARVAGMGGRHSESESGGRGTRRESEALERGVEGRWGA